MEKMICGRGYKIKKTTIILNPRGSGLCGSIAMKKVIINIVAIVKVPVLIAGDGVLKTH